MRKKIFKMALFKMLASILDQIQRTKVDNITINVEIISKVHYVLVIKLMKNINKQNSIKVKILEINQQNKKIQNIQEQCKIYCQET